MLSKLSRAMPIPNTAVGRVLLPGPLAKRRKFVGHGKSGGCQRPRRIGPGRTPRCSYTAQEIVATPHADPIDAQARGIAWRNPAWVTQTDDSISLPVALDREQKHEA